MLTYAGKSTLRKIINHHFFMGGKHHNKGTSYHRQKVLTFANTEHYERAVREMGIFCSLNRAVVEDGLANR